MKRFLLSYVLLCLGLFSAAQGEQDPDLPSIGNRKISKEEYLIQRQKYFEERRGVPGQLPYNPRVRAINEMKTKERLQRSSRTSLIHSPTWIELGPSPIPNGQTSGVSVPVSGRTTAIAIHPANENIVYVGTANGGVFRSMNGGVTWTPIFDSAQSLAIGALALAPSNPSILYVGTGEPNLSGDSFIGVGVYRIENADAVPVLVGPINPPITYTNPAGSGTYTTGTFSFRAISRILVHPTNPAIIFVSTTQAVAGNPGTTSGGLNSIPPIAQRGVYRSTNATAAPNAVTFTKLVVDQNNCFDLPCTGNINITDMVMEPGNPNNLMCWALDATDTASTIKGGGIYKTINSLAPSPVFTKVYSSTEANRGELAITKVDGNVIAYAGTGESNGRVLRSLDSGNTWAIAPGTNTFCNPQCFYDIAIAVDPTNAARVYLGGSSGNNIFKRSLDSAKSFQSITLTLHADVHALAVAPSNPMVIYQGNDGGIYRSNDGASTWQSLNTPGFFATQFQSLFLHPTDVNFTLGGTQDNGTILRNSAGVFRRADFGDGGYALVDQNVVLPNTSILYHTYFNNSRLAGYARVNNSAEAFDGNWDFFGCLDGVSRNGIACPATTLFYAPLALGPGTPNTVYFGTDVLYRSADTGVNNVAVSQKFTSAISTISVTFQDDKYRIIGLQNGQVFATTTGSSTLVNITPPISTARPVGRVYINPANKNIAYVCYTGYGLRPGEHIWKTTNLNNLGGTGVTWTIAGNGLPDVPVNAFTIDSSNANTLYAGTDVGVFASMDAGNNWSSFNSNLPVVPVFDMMIQRVSKTLRIATHGRGLFETAAIMLSPLPVTLNDFTANVRNGTNVLLQWYTSAEVNNKGFEVQRAVSNGTGDLKWVTIGFVNGSGTTSSPRRYEFEDVPLGGKKFVYRLKQVDDDNNIKFLPQRQVVLSRFDFALFPVYPNPVQTLATLKYQLPDDGVASLTIHNGSGSLVKTVFNERKEAGIYQVDFSTAGMAAGTYYLTLRSGQYFNTKPFVVTP